MHKLAISGKMRAGKNTVASIIVEKMQYPTNQVKIVGLADPMKHMVKTMFPEASTDYLFGPSELRAQPISPQYLDANGNVLTHRQALLDLGAFGRKYNKDIWLNCLVEDAKTAKDISLYIVPDVRFVNEFNYLKQAGFTMIRVRRDGGATANDISETEQDAISDSEFDFVIENNASLNDIRNIVAELLISRIKK
jgi:hypothetical protein